MLRLTVLLFVLAPLALPAQEPEPKSVEQWFELALFQYRKREFSKALASLNEVMKREPKNAEALDRRGDVHFMLGKFKESAKDFDDYLVLQPKKANEHWRRGISLYYAGRFEDGKKQFEGYEKYDTNDVENAVWHFLCAAKKDGLKPAREGILKIGNDGRIPMMEVYKLFQGKCQPEDVMKAAEDGKVDEKMHKSRLFYAHLYLGLYYDATGDVKKAAKHMEQASEKYRISHYMGEVARVHHEVLSKGAK